MARAFGSTFKPAPAGLHHAVCVDQVDRGVLSVSYQGRVEKKHKVDLFWETAEVNPENGKRYLVRKRFTLSLDRKATLRKDLESWRGRPFTDAQLAEGFELEVLVGVPCQLMIQHNNRAGEVYADVITIVPAKGLPALEPSADYVRWKDRPENQPDAAPPEPEREPGEDDDIPF